MRTQPLRHALLLLALTSAASAQSTWRIEMSDVAAPLPGATRITAHRAIAAPAPEVVQQMPGWPVTIGGNGTFAPTRGAVLADLDRDGRLDIIVSSTDAYLYAWDLGANPLPGFPVRLNSYAQTAPSAGDLDGDGDLEIVQFTRGLTSGGRLYILDHLGVPLPGFPRSVNGNNMAGSPTLTDLDDDGELEILVPERAYPIGYLHVFEKDGSEWGGNWPAALDHVPACTPAVGDLDGDGSPEIVFLSYNSIFVFERDGSIASGWPQQIPNAKFSYQSPALADLDGDGDLEIAVGAHRSAAGVYVYQHDGTLMPGWPRLVGTWTYCPPTIADLEGDGALEILSGREGSGPGTFSQVFWAWDTAGRVKPGFPFTSSNGGGTAGPITVADIDHDGSFEIFCSHNIMQSGNGFLFGVDARGTALPGFPLRPRGFTYQNGATIADVDGDGDLELAVLSHDASWVDVNLYDLPTAAHPADITWPTYHQNPRRGGLRGSQDKLTLSGHTVRGASPTLFLLGAPGGAAGLWASATSGLLPLPPLGWLRLDLNTIFFLHGATLPPSGELALPLAIPPDPALAGAAVFFQGATISGARGHLSNLLSKVVG